MRPVVGRGIDETDWGKRGDDLTDLLYQAEC